MSPWASVSSGPALKSPISLFRRNPAPGTVIFEPYACSRVYVIDTAFRGLTPDQKVVDLDSRQPEFTLTYGKYVGQSVTPDR